MRLIQVDVIGLQTLQAGGRGCQDMLSRKPLVVDAGAYSGPALGGEHKLVAFANQPAAHDFFGAPCRLEFRRHWINVSRVDEIDAVVRGLVEDFEGNGLVALSSKSHGAKTD